MSANFLGCMFYIQMQNCCCVLAFDDRSQNYTCFVHEMSRPRLSNGDLHTTTMPIILGFSLQYVYHKKTLRCFLPGMSCMYSRHFDFCFQTPRPWHTRLPPYADWQSHLETMTHLSELFLSKRLGLLWPDEGFNGNDMTL